MKEAPRLRDEHEGDEDCERHEHAKPSVSVRLTDGVAFVGGGKQVFAISPDGTVLRTIDVRERVLDVAAEQTGNRVWITRAACRSTAMVAYG